MLVADRISVWRSRYRVILDGREITTWDSSIWRGGGDFELAGRQYHVRGNAWGNRFTMVDAYGLTVASADRVGRKRWTVEANGQTYHFRRVSLWNGEQELHVAGVRIGSVKRSSAWRRGQITADLPALPPPVQVFVLGVVITMWNSEAAAAAG